MALPPVVPSVDVSTICADCQQRGNEHPTLGGVQSLYRGATPLPRIYSSAGERGGDDATMLLVHF
jgi:hypothetical protein